MVPGSTFRYGSHFWRVTLSPRLSSRQPIEAAATPLPSEETTPPVTKIYFGVIRAVWRPGSSASALNCFASSNFSAYGLFYHTRGGCQSRSADGGRVFSGPTGGTICAPYNFATADNTRTLEVR